MIELLRENTLLLLFLVSAIGYALGNLSIRNMTFGVSAVLFTGLAFGGIDPNLKIPEIIIFLGLSMFVYTIGLTSGPGFFSAFKNQGKVQFLFVLLAGITTMGITVGIHFLFGLEKITSASVYAGAQTNTPALAALLDVISVNNKNDILEVLQKKAVVGYSLSYPMGVLAAIFAIATSLKILKIDLKKEEKNLKKDYPVKQILANKFIEINNPNVIGKEIRDIKSTTPFRVVFGRVLRNGKSSLTNYDTIFEKGDKVYIVADDEDMNQILNLFGPEIEPDSDILGDEYQTRRIFVSNPDIAGQKLATININQKFSAMITRITRGDIELLASPSTTLELGDRVRILGRKKDIPAIKDVFGDSYEALSHINLLSFGLGLALGLILGMISISLPGGLSFNLGYAGGPLLVALVLGNLRRTGPIVWTLPYSANLTLQQIGLTLLLAGIGINSGHAFFETVATYEGIKIFAAGTLLTYLSATIILILGYKLLKIPFSLLMGMAATQPAVLDFATRNTNNKLPILGYTTMMPILLILKLLIVQLLYALLS